MTPRYTFDDKQVRLSNEEHAIGRIIGGILRFFFFTIALAVLSYAIVAIFFNTDTERRLKQENRMYSKIYPEMVEKDELLSDVVTGLQVRDNEIYKGIFHTEVPAIDKLTPVDPLLANINDVDIASMTNDRIGSLEEAVAAVEENFRAIRARMQEENYVMPPMRLPLRNFNYTYTGATVGHRINPFYKVQSEHHGIDLIVPTGTPVYATGEGIVTEIARSVKGQGKVVEITHAGGYVTRYAHLDEILVAKGRSVDEGTMIGKSGSSGTSFAPHLHYEVIKDGNYEDPMNYFFGSLSPEEYAGMLLIAATSGQSMD